MLVLTLLVLTLTVVTVRHVTSVSAIDEREHVDFLVKAAHLRLDQVGDRPAEQSLVEMCTRGSQYYNFAPCRPGNQDARAYYVGGVITASEPPLYFFLTGLPARALQAISPAALPPRDSLVTWGRLLGGVWLLVGCYLTLVAGDLLGLQRRLVVLAIILAVGTPALLHATTIINTDATAFAAGAGVLLAALAWERRSVGYWALALAAILAIVLKLPNLVGVVIVIAYFIGRAICSRLSIDDEGLRTLGDYAKVVAVLIVGGIVAVKGSDYVLSFLHHHVTGKPDTNPFANRDARSVINLYRVHGLSLDRVFGFEVFPQLLPPVVDVAPPIARQGGIYQTFATFARYLLVVPALGLLLAGRRFQRAIQVLGVAALTSLLVTPVLLVLYWYYSAGTNDQVPPRYGLSAMPVLVLLLAAAAGRGRVGTWVLGAMAAAMYLGALLTNLV